MTGRKLSAYAAAIVAIGGLGLVPAAAQAAPDISGTTIVNEDDGFPGVCTAPCFAVQKLAEVWFAGNPTAPIACGAKPWLPRITSASSSSPDASRT
jgi:hypothetical protein